MQPTVTFQGFRAIADTAGRYGNGRIAIQLVDAEDGLPVAKASVNVPDANLAPDEIAIKDYFENEGMLDALLEAGVVEAPHRRISAGYVQGIPVVRLRTP
jgi:hypothetical protein